VASDPILALLASVSDGGGAYAARTDASSSVHEEPEATNDRDNDNQGHQCLGARERESENGDGQHDVSST